MKRYILMALAVALTAVSCSRTYEVNHSQGVPVGFTSWNDVMTKGRAVGETGNSFSAGDKFYVYGSKYVSTTPTTVFDGVTVSTTDGTTWTYSPTRFWDSNTDSYVFYAVSPSEDVAVADLISAHDVAAGTMTSTVRTFSGSNEDILVAGKKEVAKANYGTDVALLFHHVGALFDLKVRLGDGLANADKTANKTGVAVNITGVSLTNIKYKGSFSVTGYDGSNKPIINTGANAGLWAVGEAPNTTTYTEMSSVSPKANAIDNTNKFPVTVGQASTPLFLIENLMVMPQAFTSSTNAIAAGVATGLATDNNSQQLAISYEITTDAGGTNEQTTSYTKYYDLTLFDKTDYPAGVDSGTDYNAGTKVSGWLAGVHYTYIITIDANAITFTATMDNWATDGGYYYIIQ